MACILVPWSQWQKLFFFFTMMITFVFFCLNPVNNFWQDCHLKSDTQSRARKEKCPSGVCQTSLASLRPLVLPIHVHHVYIIVSYAGVRGECERRRSASLHFSNLGYLVRRGSTNTDISTVLDCSGVIVVLTTTELHALPRTKTYASQHLLDAGAPN